MWGAAAILCLGALIACNSSKKEEATEGKLFPLKGRVVSVDKNNSSMVVDGEAIPGLMDAMAMPYTVKNASELEAVTAGDSITATVVQQKDSYFVTGIKVAQHATTPAPKPAADAHVPEPGDAVPNFQLVNQSGRKVSLDQYRGKTLLVTFIYTRCPFEDFCPRMSGQFAEINRELRKDARLYGKTHLLSISFDPKNDTPKVLQTYGAGYMGSKSPSFDHWEFAVPPAAELRDLAKYFGLTYSEDGGVITHSLSTAVIGPDGKIFKWYHGNEWKSSDLLKDAEEATHPAGSKS
jgi:protein SCO1